MVIERSELPPRPIEVQTSSSKRCSTGPVVLVPTQAALDQWARFARSLPWVRGRRLVFEVLGGDAQTRIAERREREPEAPIGFIAEDEPTVLAALAGGADEASVVPMDDAALFAAFVDRLELRARLRTDTRRLHEAYAHAERLTALGTLVAGVGHEINNPLSVVILSVEAARRHLLPSLEAASQVARATRSGDPLPAGALATLGKEAWTDADGRGPAAILDEIASAADAIASVVRDLRIFARSDRDEPADRVDVRELIDHAIRLSGREASRRGVLERDYADDLPTLVVPRARVTQVIMNVFVNALHAIDEIERPSHRIRISARADEDFVAIAVTDTGPGIAPDALERIFDPFFTTKRQALGTGLGLSISREILRRLGGELSVESVFGEGATFLCFLPISSPEALERAGRATPPAWRSVPAMESASVLVVDDDERVLRSYARLLGQDHRLMVAYDGREAMEMIQSGSAPDVLVVEVDLPGSDGREFIAWLQAEHPALARRTILATSGGSRASVQEFLHSYSGVVVHKPLRGPELLAAIEAVARG
jgi:signal transduction histidine kinase/CheY-like chemotaxis protein